MAAILYPLYSLVYIGLFIWAIFLWFRQHSLTLVVLFAILGGLLYDNTVITVGQMIGTGEPLEMLNYGRYLIHVIVTPLLILAALDQTKRFGIQMAQAKWMQAVLGILTLAMIVLGLAAVANIQLEPETFGGTLRYVDVSSSGPPIPAIVTILAVLVMGIAVWRHGRWPWLFAGALVMFLGSAVPPSVVGPIVGSSVEIVLLVSLLATEKHIQQMRSGD
ncbi:MAG: hypothetical protein HC804_05880 [Anaerolineae bacterium]|nr:hypothetical protein [Anaerolineae bacterium]